MTEVSKRNVPRSILLPSYMRNVPLWEQLCAAMDVVLGADDWAIAQLRTLRDPYAIGPQIQKAIAEGSLYDTTSSEFQQDINLLLKQLAFSGLSISKPSFLSAQQILLLFRNIGEYWFAKGTGKIVDFFNYTLGAEIELSPCWTEDYVTFVSEATVLGDPLTYPTVMEGGTWYPTTHVDVNLGSDELFSSVPIQDFVAFFRDTFNYNLVLNTINTGVRLAIVGSDFSMNLYVEESFTIPMDASLAPGRYPRSTNVVSAVSDAGTTVTSEGVLVVVPPNTPRYDGLSGQLIVEPAFVNRYSSTFLGTQGAGIPPVVTPGAATGPDNVPASANRAVLSVGASSSSGDKSYLLWFLTAPGVGKENSASVWLKSHDGTPYFVRFNFSGITLGGFPDLEVPIEVTASWQKFDIRMTTPTDANLINAWIAVEGGITPGGFADIDIYGEQQVFDRGPFTTIGVLGLPNERAADRITAI